MYYLSSFLPCLNKKETDPQDTNDKTKKGKKRPCTPVKEPNQGSDSNQGDRKTNKKGSDTKDKDSAHQGDGPANNAGEDPNKKTSNFWGPFCIVLACLAVVGGLCYWFFFM